MLGVFTNAALPNALALQDGKEYNGREIIVERADGTQCAALAHVNPLHDDSGMLVGAVNVVVDISVRKKAEAVLKEADLQKTQFLPMLVHELRNPLAPIRNGLDLMRLANDDLEADPLPISVPVSVRESGGV